MIRLVTQNDYRFYTYRYNSFHHTDMHKGCDLHYLTLLVKGNARIVTQTETLQLHQGDVFYIPRGLRYHSYWHGDPQIEFLSFGFPALPPADQKGYMLQRLLDSDQLASMLKQIPIQDQQVNCQALGQFYAALAKALELMSYDASSVTHRIADQAMHYIRQHPHAQVSDIAQVCGVSQAQLYAKFRSATGTTPNKYRKKVLCDLAIELLKTTDLTVEDISDKLDFSSPSYFRKVISQATGLTPRKIRAQRDIDHV